MIIAEDLFYKIVDFIKTHKDPLSRIGLPREKYKDWGSFVRTFDDKIPDEICPRYLKLSLEYGEIKPAYKKCITCDHCKENDSSYNGLINLYLFYGYWFWQNIIDSESFIEIIIERMEKNGRF